MKFLQQTQTICSQYVPGHRALPMAVPRAWTPHSSWEPLILLSTCTETDPPALTRVRGCLKNSKRRQMEAAQEVVSESHQWQGWKIVFGEGEVSLPTPSPPVRARAEPGASPAGVLSRWPRLCFLSTDTQGCSERQDVIVCSVWHCLSSLKSREERVWWGSQLFCLGYKNRLSGISVVSLTVILHLFYSSLSC